MIAAYSIIFAAYYRAVILHEEKVLLGAHQSFIKTILRVCLAFFLNLVFISARAWSALNGETLKLFADSAWFLAVILLFRVITLPVWIKFTKT